MPLPLGLRALPLRLERLESRETPAAAVAIMQTFDAAPFGGLPTDWTQLGVAAAGIFAAGPGQNSADRELISSGPTTTEGRAWRTAAASADNGVQAIVEVDGSASVELFARGKNLSGNPSYYAVNVAQGRQFTLVRVVDGQRVALATVTSASSVVGMQLQISLELKSTQLSVEIVRTDTGHFLNAQGTWQSAAARALSTTDSVLKDGGQAGVARRAFDTGRLTVDDFAILQPPPSLPVPNPVSLPSATQRSESFNGTSANALPSGWSEWSSDGTAGFGVSGEKPYGSGLGLVDNGSSTHAARAWMTDILPGDAQVSASMFLSSLSPTHVFLRGSNLDTKTPTYYAATLTRGMELRLVEVVSGQATTLKTLKSSSYFSSNWTRVTLSAFGDRLQVSVQRLDTNQWLNGAGSWQSAQTSALEVQDATITGSGRAGVGREASYAGAVYFDDFAVSAGVGDTQPPTASASVPGNTVSGTVTISATAADASGIERVEFWIDGSLRATDNTAPYQFEFDTRTLTNGSHSLLVKAYDPTGNVGTATQTFTVSNTALALPTVPRHYSHIRIAQLAYSTNPMGDFEQQLLRDSVDLVVPNTKFLQTIANVSPQTPQLIYTNVSNLYETLLADWLNYADRTGTSREHAFYHVTQATPFTGNSPSSQPVTWFWNVGRGPATGTTATNLTYSARSSTAGDVAFGATGEALYFGWTDRFREANFNLSRGAATGWNGVVEYVSSVDSTGKPSAWKTLTLKTNTTNGLAQSGQIVFDPPVDWKAAMMPGYTARFYYLRVRTTAGTAANAPIATTILGRDYVNANGGTTGTIPAFDSTADKDGDGYLNDTEFATRANGKDARFVHESRLFYPYYGQMRFVTNPSSSAMRGWAGDYHKRLLGTQPLAGGVFVDNSAGKLPIAGIAVAEGTASYASDYGAVLAAMNAAIAPKWVLANTAGGSTETDQVVRQVPATIEEFALRPLATTWSGFNDMASLVARRQSLSSPTPYLILDSLPTGGSPTDARTQIATLAYYYLLGNPETTFLMFYGGNEPASTWTRHWSPAAAYNVGQPQGAWSTFATGLDPANSALTYKIMQRSYSNALVLYKPMSYALGKGTGTLADTTATTHVLNGNYRLLRADNTLGPVINQVTLRNGEGAILIKA